ncbi:MAG: hypothetical protein KAY32_10230 [Candidatus Eisenbacteria sp.]|nr:hypothetical protein [Candidatus Eisenbacteria bacterium]
MTVVSLLGLLPATLVAQTNGALKQGEPPGAAGRAPASAADSLAALADSLAALPDSLAALRDSLAAGGEVGTWADSLAAGADSAALGAADALARAAGDSLDARPRRWWDAGWALRQLPAVARQPLLEQGAPRHSTSMLLSDALWREAPIGVHRSGNHGAWDLPYCISPGLDRLSLWLAGQPTSGPGIPEALTHTLSPLPIGELSYLAPDPWLDPLARGGDGMLWAAEREEPWQEAPSAVRISEGPGGAAAEELYLGRRNGPWGFTAAYAHSHSDGRPFWVMPRYSYSRYQNIRLTLDRATPDAGWRVAAADRTGRTVLEEAVKLYWQTQELSLQGQFAERDWLTVELALTRRNDLLRRWGPAGMARRRSRSTEGVVRMAANRGSWSLLLVGALAGVDVTLERDSFYVAREAQPEIGTAVGVARRGEVVTLVATGGWSDPWWGKEHLRGHVWVGLEPVRGVRLSFDGWMGATTPFVPRLDGDFAALLDESILLPGGVEATGVPLRRVRHGELGLTLGTAARSVSVGGFVREVEGAIGLDPAQALLLGPAEREAQRLAALTGEARLAGLSGRGDLKLPLGLRIYGDGLLFIRPERELLPVLTARYEARAGAALGFALFRGDLFLEGRLLGLFRDRWVTPAGEAPRFERYDGEIHATVLRRAHLFMATRNLRNEEHFSASYVDGEWMTLPFQSTEIGLEWHFLR